MMILYTIENLRIFATLREVPIFSSDAIQKLPPFNEKLLTIRWLIAMLIYP